MIHYPIFIFHSGGKLSVYDELAQFQSEMCCMDCISEVLDLAYDSDGWILTQPDDVDETLVATDEQDREQLRRRLLEAMRGKGQQWDDDSALAGLISAAQQTYETKSWSIAAPIGSAVTAALRSLGLKASPLHKGKNRTGGRR
jgi:hypothetical protein